MKKTVLAIVFVVVIALPFIAQGFEPKTYRWNIEPGYMWTFGENNITGFAEQKCGYGFLLETRYRLNSGIDFGLYTSIAKFERNYEHLSYEDFKIYNNIQFMSVNIMPTVSYNHRVNRFVELFGGVGLGWMYGDNSKNVFDADGLPKEDSSCNSLVFMPRVGVKVRNHLRFSAGYKFQEKANSHAFISVGWTFGIGKIK